jgi:hypothetical protein
MPLSNQKQMSNKEFYNNIICMEYEDIILKFGDNKNKMIYQKFYKDWLEFNKQITLTSAKQLEKELKLGLYGYICKIEDKILHHQK